MSKLHLRKFEEIMKMQKGKEVTFSHIGSFDHSHIFKNFVFEIGFVDYSFKDSNTTNPDEELLLSSILKSNITYIEYLPLGNQIELKLLDSNKILINLSDMEVI